MSLQYNKKSTTVVGSQGGECVWLHGEKNERKIYTRRAAKTLRGSLCSAPAEPVGFGGSRESSIVSETRGATSALPHLERVVQTGVSE